MQYARLGKTGMVVSRIALGLMSYASEQSGDAKWVDWVLANDEAEKYVKQALDAGITFFDTAEIYSEGRSEEFFGKALKKLLPDSHFKRSDLCIATKIYPTRTMRVGSEFGGLQKGFSRKALIDAVEGSLKRLQLDYIDVYFLHRFDPNTAIEETMRALHDLVSSGKIRYLGASSMYCWQFAKMQKVAEENGWTKFTVMQNHYNAIYREEEREMIPYCIDSGVSCTPYSPLASGVLCRPVGVHNETTRSQTDRIQKLKYFKTGDDEVSAVVQEIAKARNVPAAQVALAWVLLKPGVSSPIIGATKQHHIEDAVKALQLKLTEEEISKIEKPYVAHALYGHN